MPLNVSISSLSFVSSTQDWGCKVDATMVPCASLVGHMERSIDWNGSRMEWNGLNFLPLTPTDWMTVTLFATGSGDASEIPAHSTITWGSHMLLARLCVTVLQA